MKKSSFYFTNVKIGVLYRKVEFILSIINNLLTLLEERGIKSSELGAAIGVSDSTMSNWKKRETDPPAKYILPICEFLKISPYELLDVTRKIEPTENVTISNPTITHSRNFEVNGIKHESSRNELSENETELLRVFNLLPTKEKIKLLNMVYTYEENFSSGNSN